MEEEQLKFVEKTTCDRPMYLEVDGSFIRVLLKEGQACSQESRLITYQLEKDGSHLKLCRLTPCFREHYIK